MYENKSNLKESKLLLVIYEEKHFFLYVFNYTACNH